MKNNLFYAFRNKQFVYLWLAEIFTQIPVNLLNFLLILVIYKLTGSNTAVSVIVLSFTLPAVFLGILAGIYTDKLNKKKVLATSNYLRAACLLLLAIFSRNIPVIYVISFIFGIITQFFIPAETPIIPVIVTESQLLSANALFGIGIFGSILIAYLISGPMLLYFGFVTTLILMTVMLFLGGLLISLIKVPASEDKKTFNIKGFSFSEITGELVGVIKIIRKADQVPGSLFLLALSQILILVIAAIAPGYANAILHISVEQFPLLVITPATIGIIVGAVYITNRMHRSEQHKYVTAGIFISGIVMILLPFCERISSKAVVSLINSYLPKLFQVTNIHLIILLAFLLGLSNSFVFIPSNTLVQEKTKDEIRGKIYGVLNTFIGIFSFLPIILVGSFADLFGVGSVLIAIGLSLICLVILRIVW